MSSHEESQHQYKHLERRLALLQRSLDYRLANRKMLHFSKWTNKNYQANWHHQVICSELDALIRGDTRYLMLFVPPRNGKSELVSRRLPAMAFGINPNEQIIGASYGAELAQSMNRDVQRIIDSDPYRRIFPETTLSGENVRSSAQGRYIRNADEFEIVGHRGYYRGAGIGGAITGKGFTLGIIDDPFKNREEADSATHRQKVWDWYTSTFYTRREANARILITLTRWHPDDLAGRLLKQAKEDPKSPQWRVVKFPAIKTDEFDPLDPRKPGEALWPKKYPLDELLSMKAVMGARDWAALMQQNPQTEGGNLVKRHWWKFYDEAPRMMDELIQSWDLTFKEAGSSYVVGQVWGRKGADKYLLDQVRDKVGFTETISLIKTLSVKWPMAGRKYIENKANGPAVMDSLKKVISGILPVEPEGSKVARANAVSGQIESGNVWLPRNAPWVHDYVEEWSQFPNGENDDQVDCTTQALRKLDSSAIERLERFLKD